jgi:hypothetical protein
VDHNIAVEALFERALGVLVSLALPPLSPLAAASAAFCRALLHLLAQGTAQTGRSFLELRLADMHPGNVIIHQRAYTV